MDAGIDQADIGLLVPDRKEYISYKMQERQFGHGRREEEGPQSPLKSHRGFK